MNAIDVLIKYWGYNQFRLKQEKIINQVIRKKDTLALLPTGGGKSICYQVPALMKEGICLVISPLIALMHDQVRHLHSKGIKSVFITGKMHYSEIETILTNCIYGGVKFLYLSPERLQNDLLRSRIKEMNINLIAIDEAHCISEWGHNFRPAYRNIHKIRHILPETPVLALTATATSTVIKDIQRNLLFKKENLIRSSFKRDNMSYVVDNREDKKKILIRLLNKIKSCVIIYVGSRKEAKKLSAFLINNKFSTNYYHAGLSPEIRKERQQSWTENQTRIMVATNSFGMGIDKADIKLVIHMHLPANIESYFQEAGRAGRNNQTAYSFLIANNNDIKKQEQLLEIKYPHISEILEVYQNIANYLQIAVNDFPADAIPFDIISFSKRYKIDILRIYHILRYLEKEEKIKFSDKVQSKSRIKIIIPNSRLYKFQITNKFYDAFIKTLLRSYNNLFNNLIVISEKEIGEQLNKSTDDVKKMLFKLKQLEVIEYQEKNNLSELIFLQARQDLNQLQLNKEKWKERKAYEKTKLESISKYITKKDLCRSQFLLHYFGEKGSIRCGICDVCIRKRNKED